MGKGQKTKGTKPQTAKPAEVPGVYNIGGRVFTLSRPVPAVRFNFSRFIKANQGIFDTYKRQIDITIATPLPSPAEIQNVGGLGVFRALQMEKAIYDLMAMLEDAGKLEELLAIGLLPEGERESTKDIDDIAAWLKETIEPEAEARLYLDFFHGVWLQMQPVFTAIGS